MIEMVIFDMDGLLLDSEQMYQRGWLKVAKNHGISLTEADMRGWSGQSASQTMAKLANHFGSKEIVEEMKAEREVFIADELARGALKLKPYAKETLAKVREKNLYCGLATSTLKKRGQMYLDYFDLAPFFDAITFGDDVKELKPDPEIYLATAAKVKANPKYTLAAEDSLTGAKAAMQAGMNVVLIPDQSLPANHRDPAEIGLTPFLQGTSLKVLLDFLKTL
ncbi:MULTISPECIES: HAD family hydrolase [Enterococcus]|jgi:HAD superfamily hydrolase (TIGR01509 family)|uniref:HAD superfamily hydrolase n=1 Tax=Enterococcus dispar ATCC 51266 TaxID=1139219 RepID=S1P0R1_9ENTE|nr:HAD family phosphatase [Enterococcus dispar]EOT38347.1 hypothetical protein OMK_02615 [Enterococcus dispar ATCC 51266]EOW85966.1 hypothetical protein I569_01289 [Enterococcus dispar ATCC 51266]MCU7356928.1 HAD family phosphatase [Enterococcus dispar]MDT2705030.1 HAD family phosphatase [Enterococcus dispar]WCG32506.1 HAD family phosphatase [Enterococcus dispar]